MKRRLSAAVLALTLAAAAGAAAQANGGSGFSDVPADHERRADIDYAAARGWLQGQEDGTFLPGQTLAAGEILAAVRNAFPEGAARADLATYIRAGSGAIAAYTAVITPNAFPDAPESHPQATDIDNAATRGWFQGYPDGTFRPARAVTAAQTATVLGRVFPDGVTRADLAAFLRAGNQALLEAGRPPARSDEPVYTQYYVQQALDLYEEDGRQAAFDRYNSADSVEGSWYLFVIEDDIIVVHPRAELRGARSSHMTDAYGRPFAQEIAQAGEDGRWVDYVFLDPASGENRQKHSWVIERGGLIFGSGWYEDEVPPPPGKDDAPAYTQYFVQQAVDRFNRDGREAVIDHYNSTESIDGPWYIFIIEDGTTVSIATNPELVGTRTGARTDVNGKNYGQELAAADERGAWVDYVRRNPAADELEQKHSWVIKRGGLIFGSGWYEDEVPPPPGKDDPPAYTQYFVQQAVDRYREDGRQAAFDHYNSAESVDGPWYIFIFENDEIIVHPTQPDLIGTNITHQTDVYGKPFGSQLAAAGPAGRWVDYVFNNPDAGTNGQKHSWVIEREGLIFGSGWYEDEVPPPPTKDDAPAYTQYFVQQAVDRYREDGRQAAFDHYNSAESVDGPWYVFVFEDDEIVVHPTQPDLIGTNITHQTDVYGKPSGQLLAAPGEAGRWVDYVFNNPDADANGQKHSWVIEREGLIFGSGWYEDEVPPPPGKDDPPAYTQYFVQQAVDRFNRDGREAVIDHYNSAETIDGPWYIFIIEDGITVSIAPNPERVGTRTGTRIDINGKNYGQELAAADERGAWVDYVRRNPATDALEQKHSWVIKRGGLIFGSGWYEPAA